MTLKATAYRPLKSGSNSGHKPKRGAKAPLHHLKYFTKGDFTMKKFFNFILFLFTGKGECAKEAIEAGVISYEGQGRDKYGK